MAITINKENLIVGSIALLLTVPLIPIKHFKGMIPYYMLMILYLIPAFFLKEKKRPSEDEGNYIPVGFYKMFFTWIIDWTVFAVFCLFYKLFLDLTNSKISIGFAVLIFFILVIQNVFYRGAGYRIFKLYINNETLYEKLKILAINFLLLFFYYFVGIGHIWNFSQAFEYEICAPFMSTAIVSFGLRLNVFKTQSLYEKFFKVQTMQFVSNKKLEA